MVERRRYSRWAGSYPQKSPAEWLTYGHVACCVSGAEAANVIGPFSTRFRKINLVG